MTHISPKPVTAGSATRIMTGAAIPEGADAVVKIEDARIEGDGKSVILRTNPVEAGRAMGAMIARQIRSVSARRARSKPV